MSWFSQNYEKAAIGGAAIAALGLAFGGWIKVGGVKDDFTPITNAGGGNDPSVPGADLISKAVSSLGLNRKWSQAEAEGRGVDLFTGIPLYIMRDQPTKPVDLFRGAAVHDPIPNIWWSDHHLDIGFADAASRDPDEDGFTNLEEFKAKTCLLYTSPSPRD